MPLNEYGEKLDSNGYAPSILHDKPVCLICGRYGTARHEVYFGSAYRAKSKRLGLWVTLCPWCHQNGPTAIHNNRDADLRLGHVKIGNGIEVTEDGTISANAKVSEDQIATSDDTSEMLKEIYGE